jgi:tubulin polyglutamylase TTLL6/13
VDDYENSLCFEILGFDVILDWNLNPFLLEVNHAPSFSTDSPLDEKIKGQVIYDTFNLLGLNQKRKK